MKHLNPKTLEFGTCRARIPERCPFLSDIPESERADYHFDNERDLEKKIGEICREWGILPINASKRKEFHGVTAYDFSIEPKDNEDRLAYYTAVALNDIWDGLLSIKRLMIHEPNATSNDRNVFIRGFHCTKGSSRYFVTSDLEIFEQAKEGGSLERISYRDFSNRYLAGLRCSTHGVRIENQEHQLLHPKCAPGMMITKKVIEDALAGHPNGPETAKMIASAKLASRNMESQRGLAVLLDSHDEPLASGWFGSTDWGEGTYNDLFLTPEGKIWEAVFDASRGYYGSGSKPRYIHHWRKMDFSEELGEARTKAVASVLAQWIHYTRR